MNRAIARNERMCSMLPKNAVKAAAAALAAGFLLTPSIGAFTLEKVRVGGPMYGQIVELKDLVADILPLPEYVIEAFLETTLAVNDPSGVGPRTGRLAKLHNDYDERRAYWRGADIPGHPSRS
jgi:hypothetical protein